MCRYFIDRFRTFLKLNKLRKDISREEYSRNILEYLFLLDF